MVRRGVVHRTLNSGVAVPPEAGLSCRLQHHSRWTPRPRPPRNASRWGLFVGGQLGRRAVTPRLSSLRAGIFPHPGGSIRTLSLPLAPLLILAPLLQSQQPALVRTAVAAQHLADTTFKLDPGIGILSPRAGVTRDSFALFLSTAEGVTWGWFVQDLSGRDSLPFALVTPLILRPNIMEFSYEESGLPVDSIAADRVRVLLGWDGEGRMRRAWVRLDSNVVLRRWARVLSESPLFFRPGVRPQFFAAPHGAAYPVVLPGGDDSDYILHPKQVRGAWLQVEVVTPADYCTDDNARRRRETVWIRYLDQIGRPTVWYYTRGC